MCSQYELATTIKQLMDISGNINSTEAQYLQWNEQVYPYTVAPVITMHTNQKAIQLMTYSLIPYWSKTAKPKFISYNARLDRPTKDLDSLELIYDAPTWKQPFKSQRCIVPLTGFYESCHEGKHAGNIIKFSHAQENKLLLAAGIYDRWTNRDTGEIIDSFAILTDNPAPFILEMGHDRQPVLLDTENAWQWLDWRSLSAKKAYDFLKSSQMKIDYNVTKIRKLQKFIKAEKVATLF